jgi:transcriptional regulator with XRE-family HTH domain
MADAKWFGGRLRELREQKGLTQKHTAEAAGITPDGLVKIERGDRIPNWETVLALAAVLGVDCTAFTQSPTVREPAKPGRPPKPKVEEQSGEKRPRSRPRKEK